MFRTDLKPGYYNLTQPVENLFLKVDERIRGNWQYMKVWPEGHKFIVEKHCFLRESYFAISAFYDGKYIAINSKKPEHQKTLDNIAKFLEPWEEPRDKERKILRDWVKDNADKDNEADRYVLTLLDRYLPED